MIQPKSILYSYRVILRIVWKASPKLFSLQLGLSLLQGFLPICLLYLTEKLIDTLSVPGGNFFGDTFFNRVTMLASLMALCVGLEYYFRNLAQICSEHLNFFVTNYVSNQIHRKSLALDLSYFENPKYLDTLHLTQKESAPRIVPSIQAILDSIRLGFSLLGVLVLLAKISWLIPLLLIFLSLPFLLAKFAFSKAKYTEQKEKTRLERKGWYFDRVLTSLEYFKETRIFHTGPAFENKFNSTQSELRQEAIRIQKKFLGLESLTYFFSVIAVFGLFLFLVHQTGHGKFSLGALVLGLGALQRGQSFLTGFFQSLSHISEHGLYINSFFEFMNLSPRVESPEEEVDLPLNPTVGIEFKGVFFTYPGSAVPTIHGMSFHISPHSHSVILGLNGSGKSTLIKLLCRFYDPQQGQICYGGIDIRNFNLEKWRAHLGVLFQDYNKYHDSLWGNLTHREKRESDLSQIHTALQVSQLVKEVENFSMGLETLLGKDLEESEELSEGQWQKIALARALYKNPKILILDEPSSHLDVLAEQGFFRDLKIAKAKGNLNYQFLIWVSHHWRDVSFADKILVLERGRCIEQGSPQELANNPTSYYQSILRQTTLT